MLKKCVLLAIVMAMMLSLFACTGSGPEKITPPSVSSSTIEVANLKWSDLRELHGAMLELLESVGTTANEEERTLLTKAKLIVDEIKPDAERRDLVGEKTEGDRLKLDLLGKAFAAGVIWWAKVFHGVDIPPSPVFDTITEGAEELGNRIGAWLVLGQTGYVKVTDPDNGIMDILYETDLGIIWAQFQVYEPAGSIYIRVPVEPALVSGEGQGNIILSEGVRPVMENCKITYRFGEVTEPTPTPFPSPAPTPTVGPSVRWQYDLGGVGNPILIGTTVYVAPDVTTHLYAIDAVTGELKWHYEAPSPIYPPQVLGETVYLHSVDAPYLYAIDVANGTIKWCYEATRNHTRPRKLVLADDTLYADHAYLEALNPHDGTLQWRYAVPNIGPIEGDTVYGYGSYVGQPAYICALNSNTGELIWRYQAKDRISSAPILYEGSLYFACDDGYIFALNASTGTEEWEWRYAATNGRANVVNGTVYPSFIRGGYFSALDAPTGNVKWSYDTGGTANHVQITDGTVYLEGSNYTVYALDAGTGTLKWKAEEDYGLIAIIGDTVYTTLKDLHGVRARDSETGQEKWFLDLQQCSPRDHPRFRYGHGITVCTGATGSIYVSSYCEPLYAIDATTAGVRWQFNAGKGIPYPHILANGLIYIVGYDGYLYALSE